MQRSVGGKGNTLEFVEQHRLQRSHLSGHQWEAQLSVRLCLTAELLQQG